MRTKLPSVVALLAMLALGASCAPKKTPEERQREDAMRDVEQKHGMLIYACQKSDIEGIKAFIAVGAKVNERGLDGERPIHAAAASGSVEAVKLLLAAGAKVDVVDMHQVQPLHVAAKAGHTEIVKILLEAGAKVDAIERLLKMQPIHFAAMNGHSESVKALLAAGGKASAKTSSGATPADLAAENGFSALGVFLKEQEAKEAQESPASK